MPTMFINPMMTTLADMNAKLLEGFAAAQKDWAEFVQRRISEDIRVARELLSSHSLADLNEVYSGYLQTAFQDYRQQAEKVAQRGERFAQHLAETTTAEAKQLARH
jgi:hypothetical protein